MRGEAGQESVHLKYPNVFTPVRLGPVELRNRFYMSPHSVLMTGPELVPIAGDLQRNKLHG